MIKTTLAPRYVRIFTSYDCSANAAPNSFEWFSLGIATVQEEMKQLTQLVKNLESLVDQLTDTPKYTYAPGTFSEGAGNE